MMISRLAGYLRLAYNPVAVIWADEKPDGAVQFSEGKWGCVMMLFAQAARGKTAVFDRKTFGCFGGGVGLGFGNQYKNFPGGLECFYRFLSTGNQQAREDGREVSGSFDWRREADRTFMEGERYIKTPELVRKFVEGLPIIDIPAKYVVFKPLKLVRLEQEQPEVIIFPVNPDQLSALVVMVHYCRGVNEAVYAPFSAGCQSIGILAYAEKNKPNPRAVIGLTDISARNYTAKLLGKEILTLAVPFSLFQEMEDNVDGSFLELEEWHKLIGGREEPA